ncbi:class II histocompatibility antigen, M beta 1 chain isoform X2 [Dromiciops gliroides]|uniref:class II histocompatibility antigen, M beta 1 chain isoform X2 n=1 Tax=Dromiciops gliroides TaxID=33562 RepID=UPI001CC6AD26|nr:class II histocompatibility antigen, M beta 1 chain isoform X2 [Dromiciops gliroides]
MRLLHLLLVGFSLGFSGAGGFVTHVETGCVLDEDGSVKDFTYCVSFNKDVLTCWDSETNKMVPVDFGILHMVAEELSKDLNKDSDLRNRLSNGFQDCASHTKPFWGPLTHRTRPPSVLVAQTTPFNTREPVMLACYVWGFYPADVAIFWLKNEQPIPYSGIQRAVQSNGDWTYQTRSYLALTPSSGDIYTCRVEHSGSSQPILETWTPGLSLKQIVKVSVSVVTLCLGLIFFFLGLVICRKAGSSDYTPLSGSNYPEGRNFS